MMLLLSLCLLVWGIACTRGALKDGEGVPFLLRGVCFMIFGGAMLLANLAGVMFSSRVLGTLLFLYGAAPLALFFSEKSFDQSKMIYSFLYALLGCLLVLFSGEKGILPALCVTVFGICIVHAAFRTSYNFFIAGDAKDMQNIGR